MIKTKREFLDRYNELGNHLRNWDTIEEVRASGYTGLLGLRGKTPGFKTQYFIPVDEAVNVPGTYFGEMAPDCITIQGEWWDGLLIYSHEPVPMKQVKEWKEASGIVALTLMRHFLDARALDEFESLRDRYPGHVIEFTAFDRRVNECNWVVWEVRAY